MPKIILFPKTILGRWSVGLVVAFFVLFIGTALMVNLLHMSGGDTVFDNLLISIPMLSALAMAIMGGFIGAVTLAKNKERSVLVIASTIFGILMLLFILVEALSPH